MPSPIDNMIDLDAVIAQDIKVNLGGVAYKLPGDAPTELLLNIMVQTKSLEELDATEVAENPEKVLEVRGELSASLEDLFRIRQPDLPEGAIQMTDTQAVELISKLFAHYYDSGDDATPPTSTRAKPRNSRPSASSRRPQRSRSSTSSPT